MSRILLRGNLGSDLEEKTSGKGNPFAKFSVAENKGADKAAEWYSCVVFDEKMISFNKAHLVKGANVILWGDLDVQRTDKGTYLNVRVLDIVNCYAKNAATANPVPKVRAGGVKTVAPPEDDSEDAPFLNKEKKMIYNVCSAQDLSFDAWKHDDCELIQLRLGEHTDDSNGIIIRDWSSFKRLVDKVDSHMKATGYKTHEQFTPEQLNNLLN